MAHVGALKEYRRKQSEWAGWLSSEEPPSVSLEVRRLLQDDVFFRAISNAEYSTMYPKAGNGKLINPRLAGLINRGFVTMQAMRIRRLVEPNPKRRNRAVVSLRRVIDDLHEHSHLITRENYVCFDGTPYLPSVDDAGNFAEYHLCNARHQRFDAIAGIDANSRAPSQTLPSFVFGKLKAKLADCNKICDVANKLIAHAADRATYYDRQGNLLSDEDFRVTLLDFDVCNQAIVSVYSFLILFVTDSSLGHLVSQPQDDPFDSLDVPIARQDEIENLRKTMEEYIENIEKLNVCQHDAFCAFVANLHAGTSDAGK